jgi:hypothetical protein
MANRRTGIDDDDFTSTTRDDPLKDIIWLSVGSGKTGREELTWKSGVWPMIIRRVPVL